MNIIKFFTEKRQCRHTKVSLQDDVAYCPDCGELIENRWYIARCACCGIKLKAIVKNGEVTAEEKFCHNCGGKEFKPEQVSKINCIDINYAVLVKTVIQPTYDEFTQSWVDKKFNSNLKLLTQT
jgi:uncharacterized protein (UPF0212 family)